MKEFKKLIDVKSIVTLALTVVFGYLSITGQSNQEFTTIYTVIIGFYFGTQFQKGNETEPEKEGLFNTIKVKGDE
ncbi:hypothetical protein G7062_11235 [Erysipelothrix sp. HDW6C]|uniref:hypothetical protein n=1 Tax=Erysipelothrix sp. HDW6C TaxID=2714930 RepID=UPI00140CC1BF|nr:hypothetical protein [Erysipelothrix sp. HDW6C]QIK70832.1 hypothetical protein G7062_11235 [Erysipelothrix sp. HDW6C]